jgi:hypothetical protein
MPIYWVIKSILLSWRCHVPRRVKAPGGAAQLILQCPAQSTKKIKVPHPEVPAKRASKGLIPQPRRAAHPAFFAVAGAHDLGDCRP